MRQCLDTLQPCDELKNLTLRPFDYQEVEYAEASSIVYFVLIRIGSQRVPRTERVRAGKNGWR